MNCINKLSPFVLCTLVLFLFLKVNSFSQPGWFPLASGSSNNLLSIYFNDINTGFISGDLGNILRTTNGGATWNNQIISANNSLNCVFFINADNGYVCGSNGIILKTVNSGLSWTQQQSGTTMCLNTIFFTGPNIGYTAGEAGTILKTENAGALWTLLITERNYSINSVYFPKEDIGYAAGGLSDIMGIILKTTDAGISWFEIFSTGKEIKSVYFVNEMTGYTAGGGSVSGNTIFKTINGGVNWTMYSASYYPGTLNRLTFTDVNTGYCSGTTGIIKTTNGGTNWFSQYSCTYPFINTMFMVNSTKGYSAGCSGLLLKTTNSGDYTFDTSAAKYYPLAIGNCWVYTNWYYELGENHYNGMNKCRIIGDTILPNGHKYFIFDFSPSMCGQSYQLERIDSSTMNVYRMNLSTGVEELYDSLLANITTTFHGRRGCGDGPPVLCSDTASITYFNSPVKTKKFIANGSVYSEYTLAKNYGFVSYSCTEGNMWGRGLTGCIINGTLYGDTSMYYQVSGLVTYSDNGQPVQSGYVKALKYDRLENVIITLDSTRISFGVYTLPRVRQDSTDIMAYGNDEELDFVPTYQDSTIFWQHARSIYPVSNLNNVNIKVSRIQNLGHANFITGKVYSVTNSPSNELSDAVIYARVGDEFKSYGISRSNGSYRVDSLPPGCYDLVVDRMGFYSDSKFVVVNGSYTIVNFYLREFAGVSGTGISMPDISRLEQNYPNPFNPVTSIEFDIPSTTHVTITIYDLLGKEVVKLIDKQMKTGSYKVDWNASDFSSGVYFYRLTTDNFTETRKMLLIK